MLAVGCSYKVDYGGSMLNSFTTLIQLLRAMSISYQWIYIYVAHIHAESPNEVVVAHITMVRVYNMHTYKTFRVCNCSIYIWALSSKHITLGN